MSGHVPHDWIPSTLGHGETMCNRCFTTNREVAALGITNACDVPPPAPKASNDNADKPSAWSQDQIDDQMLPDDEDDNDLSEECGRWHSGGLSEQCLLVGTEWCDWLCPIGLPHRRPRK